MVNKALIVVVVLCGFLLGTQGVSLVDWWGERDSWGYLLFTLLNRSFWLGVVPVLSLLLLYSWRKIPQELGLDSNIGIAWTIGFICTAPMLLYYGFRSGFSMQWNLESVLLGALFAALLEEICFRGFLFGQLYRRVKLWFPVAAGASAIVFGLGHLYQGNSLGETIGVFLVTLVGGIWFSWLFVRWNFNLWVPVSFHCLMNFYWSVFAAGNNALGGVEANIPRVLVIILSIWLTMRWSMKLPDQTKE